MTNHGRKGSRMTDRGTARTVLMAVAAILPVLFLAQSVAASETLSMSNGINATIHGPQEITDALTLNKDGSAELIHPAVGSLTLDADDGSWTPFDTRAVVDALAAMRGFTTDLDVEVFILPAPPAEIGSSFARRGAIFLAPGTGPVPEQTIAYITTHEMGHVLTWAFLDDRPQRWDAYLALRGLDESNLSPVAAHADRAREIVAEDIRFLFGGVAATRSGTIENHDLVEPDRVIGLEEMLADYFAADAVALRGARARAFPNPCNPLTTIEMALDSAQGFDGSAARLQVYDIRGALIRTVSGGHVANGTASIQWNGADESGGMASSGRYLYVFRVGSVVGRGSVTLVR